MTLQFANLVNAFVLIACSIWAYAASGAASSTALIPACFGILLLVCHPGVKAQHKSILLIAALLIVIILAALVMPMKGAISREDPVSVFRVGLMMLTSVMALGLFAKNLVSSQ
ncbi:MAG: hypothetical protein AAF346_23020 [Pseudomonadota bacterium]